MKPAPFEYLAPRDVEEVLAALARYGDDAKILAGGQSLVPAMNLRLARPRVLVDINRVRALAGVAVEPDGLRLGALVRQRQLERDPEVRRSAPLLAEAAPFIGHVPTRTRGTVCGSVAHGDPAAELPACMLALDAIVHARSTSGARAIRAADLYRGVMTTALAPDELLVAITVPRPVGLRLGSAFVEVSRRHGDFALVGVAAVVGLDAGDVCRHARLALLGVGDVPHVSPAARSLVGARLAADGATERLTAVMGRAIAEALAPPSDLHASAAYRRRVASALAGRALFTAARRALGPREASA